MTRLQMSGEEDEKEIRKGKSNKTSVGNNFYLRTGDGWLLARSIKRGSLEKFHQESDPWPSSSHLLPRFLIYTLPHPPPLPSSSPPIVLTDMRAEVISRTSSPVATSKMRISPLISFTANVLRCYQINER